MTLGIDYDQAIVVALARRLVAVSLGVACGIAYLAVTRTDRQAGSAAIAGTLTGAAAGGARAVTPSAEQTQRRLDPAFQSPTAGVPLEVLQHADRVSRTEFLEFTHDAIIIWEMDGRGICYFNRAAEQLYGYGREQVHGLTTHAVLRTRPVAAMDVREMESQLARFGVWVGELIHTAADGRMVVVDARLALLAQRDGRSLVLEVNRDITDERAAERARDAAQGQLERLRRLSSSQ